MFCWRCTCEMTASGAAAESFELSRDGVMLEGLFVLFRALFPV
ncbi:unnamed protein product [Ascophyllum nodosum]